MTNPTIKGEFFQNFFVRVIEEPPNPNTLFLKKIIENEFLTDQCGG